MELMKDVNVCLNGFLWTSCDFDSSEIKLYHWWFRQFFRYYMQLVNYIWCMKWLLSVHNCLVVFIWPWPHFHGSMVNINFPWLWLFSDTLSSNSSIFWVWNDCSWCSCLAWFKWSWPHFYCRACKFCRRKLNIGIVIRLRQR